MKYILIFPMQQEFFGLVSPWSFITEHHGDKMELFETTLTSMAKKKDASRKYFTNCLLSIGKAEKKNRYFSVYFSSSLLKKFVLYLYP